MKLISAEQSLAQKDDQKPHPLPPSGIKTKMIAAEHSFVCSIVP